ncbi:MAG: hypothetical protein JJT76_19690 [Clostridiaceae bacterium]|nr:hypothetical protein [Clostridiaceae bacterium]
MKIANTFLNFTKLYDFKNVKSSSLRFEQFVGNREKNVGSIANKYEKYDPRNCTFDEFCVTIKTLVKEEKLASHDILLGTLDVEKSFKRMNPSFKYYMTSTDSEGRRNWVDEFDALANRELARGNMLGYKRHMERKELAVKALELINQSPA